MKTLHVVNDLNAGLACCGKSFEDFCKAMPFGQELCETLLKEPKSQPIRTRTLKHIIDYVGEGCQRSLSIVSGNGRYALFS